MPSTLVRRLLAIGALVGLSAVQPLIAQKNIPTPESFFGFSIGAEKHLVDYTQSIDYFKKLAASSKYVKLINVGTTAYGRPWTAVIISSQDNLKKLDHYKEVNQRLAHPQGLSEADAHKLALEGKVIVDISGGLHASEIAGSQHTPQLAYELLSHADDPANKAILDNVIFFLWPTINPDGQDIVVNDCRARDAGQPTTNALYEKYVGHDNNRDAYMLNVVESRVVARVWNEWEPDVVYVHHQSSPEPTRIWLPPFAEPVGTRAPPIAMGEVNVIGLTIASYLDAHDQPGAVHQLATYDAWYPGYIDGMGVYQNRATFFSETQGGSCTTPTQTRFSTEFKNDLRPGALYTNPWAGGQWTLRNAVDYMVSASMATLNYAAKYKTEVLYNRYLSGHNVIKKYSAGGPYAYLIPQSQWDPVAPVELLRRMAYHGVRINQTERDISYEGKTYPRGTWIIPMDQEYAELVRELFEAQKYPDLGDDTPYDAAGWTLPYQMNVNVVEGATPLSADIRAAMKPVIGKPIDWKTDTSAPFTTNAVAAGIIALPGGFTGSGNQLSVDPTQNNAFRFINRALANGATLKFTQNGAESRYLISGLDAAKADSWANELWVKGTRGSEATATAVTAHIALYKGSAGNMDEGWTEWMLDTYGFKYTILTPTELAAGNLNTRFDVILFGSQGLAGGGGRGGAAPAAGAGDPVKAVDDFVKAGGTVVFWNGGTNSAISSLKLPVRNVITAAPRGDYYTAVSVMRIITDPTHPVMAGMPMQADVVVSGSPVFATTEGFEGAVLAKYPADTTPLRSGFLKGEKYMKGYIAALDVKHDKGHAILFAFQPEWRGQPTASFRMVFNSLFYSGDMAAKARGKAGFWTAPR